jgi:hypothetical protein
MAATLEQLAVEVEALKQQVEPGRRALDELEIQKVQSLYSHYYQVGMRSEVASLFAQHTPGVTMEIEDSGVYEGIESITRFWNTVFARDTHFSPGFMAVHMTCNPVIEIDKNECGWLVQNVYNLYIIPSISGFSSNARNRVIQEVVTPGCLATFRP